MDFVENHRFDENCGFQPKTADFLPKFVVFDENCRFQPKAMDFAVCVWFFSLKLENC